VSTRSAHSSGNTRAQRIAGSSRCSSGFTAEVHLLAHGPSEFVDQLEHRERKEVSRALVQAARDRGHDVQVAADDLGETWPPDLHRDGLPRAQPRSVHLRDRGGGERRFVELREEIRHRLLELTLDLVLCIQGEKSGRAVLEVPQLPGQRHAYHVGTAGEELTELDERRAQLLEREADAAFESGLLQGAGFRAPEPSPAPKPDPAQQVGGAVPREHAEDLLDSSRVLHGPR
jgi:hypothetical protein